MMDYEKAYKAVLQTATQWIKDGCTDRERICLECVFPELRESEDERIRKRLLWFLANYTGRWNYPETRMACRAWLEKQKEPADKGEISDGYHTFNELYYYRMLYNAAFFNLLPKHLVHKSRRHHDGEECFGGGWFIVMAQLPTGQISNHYELKDWDLFQVPEQEKADEWDGHTPKEAAERIFRYLQLKQKPAEWSEEDEKRLESIIHRIEVQFSGDLYGEGKLDVDWLKNRLKFLRPQPHWKPSEEQMEALENSTALTEEQGEALYSLVQDLKKLM